MVFGDHVVDERGVFNGQAAGMVGAVVLVSAVLDGSFIEAFRVHSSKRCKLLEKYSDVNCDF